MSDENQSAKTSWTSVQVYTMSVLCLLVGVTVGYLFHGPTASHPSSATAPAAQTQQQMPGMNPAIAGTNETNGG